MKMKKILLKNQKNFLNLGGGGGVLIPLPRLFQPTFN